MHQCDAVSGCSSFVLNIANYEKIAFHRGLEKRRHDRVDHLLLLWFPEDIC